MKKVVTPIMVALSAFVLASASASANDMAKNKDSAATASKSTMSQTTDTKAATGATTNNAKGGTYGGNAMARDKSSFDKLDKNHDGFIDQLEAAGDANAKSNFKKLDKNGDMKLSPSEWQAKG